MSAPSRNIDAEEVQELRDKIWVMAQRLSVLLVALIAGVMLGLIKPEMIGPLVSPLGIQGPAGRLTEEVEALKEQRDGLKKERDTLNSKVALMDRDKKELEQQTREALAKAAACGN